MSAKVVHCHPYSVLYLETFANQIRLDNNIPGLSLPRSTLDIKISLYADDTNGIVTDDRSAELFLHKALLFNQASGFKLNLEKSKGIFFGKWRDRSDHPFGISWIHFSKILGTNLCNFVTYDDRWFGIFSKFTKTLKNFKQRHISLRGKSYVINCLTS